MVQHRGWIYLALTALPWVAIYAIFQVSLSAGG